MALLAFCMLTSPVLAGHTPGPERVLPSAQAFAPRPQGTTAPQLLPSVEARRRLLEAAVQWGGDIDGDAAVLRNSRSVTLSSDDSRVADGARVGDGAGSGRGRALQSSPSIVGSVSDSSVMDGVRCGCARP